MMRTSTPTLAIVALVGFCSQAAAQEQCPELTRLRSEAADALKKATGVATQDRCDAYIRVSIAWADIARYAKGHRELCDISVPSLSEIDKLHREAVEEREIVCGARRRNLFPPEIKFTFPPEVRPRW
jgi:hypothetical protein